MKKLFTAVFFLIFVHQSYGQEDRFFIPKEIKNAYENSTRSYDGTPGKYYWQNTVDYVIEAEIAPQTRELTGTATITYHNNSPNPLNNMILRLYHDLFRKGNIRAQSVLPSDVNDGVKITRMTYNGDPINMNQAARRSGTNLYISLPETLDTESKATLGVDWSMIIPETTERTGAYDSTSFFVAYWYPQIAVYDDIFGWDQLSYDFSTEFYNNLANFDVTLKAPEQFTILATGELQNAAEVLPDSKYELYSMAKTSDETINILTVNDIANRYKNKSGTWHYIAKDVTDFSFCMSDHFVWDGAKQDVEDREVFISSYYNMSVAQGAKNLTSTQQKAMKHFSEDMPGIPYPYPEFTTCVTGYGAGAMETPMMANNSSPNSGTVHEMMHTYFPMYVRTNEKRFAWMDEGWANFNGKYLSKRFFQNDDGLMIEGYSEISGIIGSFVDLPLITSSQFLDNSNYGYATYPLPEFIYTVLHHELGNEVFTKCYREYIRRWAKKSPTPYDFFYTFEDVSGQDLTWFITPWFFRYGDVDLAISSFEKGNLNIKNQSNRPVPIVIEVLYKDSTTFKKDLKASVWKLNDEVSVEIPKASEVLSLVVNRQLPDSEILNNFYPSLKQRYGDYKIPELYLGEYPLNEFPVSVIIKEEDGLTYMAISGSQAKIYLLPTDENSFQDITGDYQIIIDEQKDGTVDLKMNIKSFGVRVTGQKD